MFALFKPRIHESVAISSLFAASAALHTAWIANLVWNRLSRTGTLDALYVFVGSVYLIIFFLSLAWTRGRDCSGLRGRAAHFFFLAVLFFVAMTLPIVYERTI